MVFVSTIIKQTFLQQILDLLHFKKSVFMAEK